MSFKTKYIDYDIESIVRKANQNIPIDEFKSDVQYTNATCVIDESKAGGELPFANGRFGTPVSTDGRSVKMQIAHGDYYPFGAASTAGTVDVEARYGCGLAYFSIDFSDNVLENGTQFMDFYEGICGYKSEQMEITFIADRERDLLGIKIVDKRKVRKSFDIYLKSAHMPLELNANHTSKTVLFKKDENIILDTTASEKCDTGISENDIYCRGTIGINVEIKPTKWHCVEFEKMSEQTVKLTVSQEINTYQNPDSVAEEIDIYIAGAASHDAAEDTVKRVNDILYYAKYTDISEICERTKQWWSDFWSKSFILLDEKNNWLDATTVFWIKMLYNMGLTKFGEYPVMHMTDILYGVNKCNVWGCGIVWFNNARYEYAMNVINHAEMNEPLFKMTKRNYHKYQKAAEQRWGSKGIYIPEAHSTDGVEIMPGHLEDELQRWYLYGEVPGKEINDIDKRRGCKNAKGIQNWSGLKAGDYTMRFCYDTGNIAEIFRMKYLYGCDEEYLRNTAYPVVRDAAEFYRNNKIVQKKGDGKYHIFPTNYAESLWGATDVIDDVSIIKSLLPTAADLAEKLGVDSELVPLWREMAENCCDFVTADDEGALSPFRTPDGKAGFAMAKKPFFDISEYPDGWFPAQDEHIRPVMDFDLVTLELGDAKDKELCMNTLESCINPEMIKKGYLKGWALDRFGTNCARLGRADLAFLRLPLQYEQIMGIERCEFDSLFNFEDIENADRLLKYKNIFDLQYWVYEEAIMECLIGCCPKRDNKSESVIYIAPAWDMKYDAKFMLSARGGFDVCCEIKDGKVRAVEIYSKCGKKCIVKNNFGKPVEVEFPNGESKSFDGEYIEFETEKDNSYAILVN